MTKPTDLQKKRFWESLGWEEIEPIFLMGEGFVNWKWCGIIDTNLTSVLLESLPVIDSNNLVKYVIPQLQEKSYQIDIVCLENGSFDVAVLGMGKETNVMSEIVGDDFALTLFWAIQPVIYKDGEV